MRLRDIPATEPERGVGRVRDLVWLAVLLLSLGVAWGTMKTEVAAVTDRMDRMEVRLMTRLGSIEAEVRNGNTDYP